MPDSLDAEHVLRALADEVTASTAAALLAAEHPLGAVDAFNPLDDPESPDKDARLSAEVIQLGWQAGGRAFAAGLSVHHVVRDADLLLAIILADLEREVEALPANVVATPADTFGAARRLQRGMGRYTQAAAAGFVHALLANMRERYRILRHDLRNPLGTIRSALSLMDDETVPEEMRHGPGIRSMVARNAGSLDDLIATGLDDAAATALLVPPQDVALRDIAIAARREVRDAARLAGCEVVVGDVPSAPPSYVDAVALELTLTALLLAALARADSGATVRIDCTDRAMTGRGASASADGRPYVVMRVTLVRATAPRSGDDPETRWEPHGLALAASLAVDHGGSLSADPAGSAAADPAALANADALYLWLPLSDTAAPAPAAV
ncbi:hypothetical protein tb265_14320 [Gemmatimonadetes bacterium T265]|nr:hypothetical protein tb265_14320 [Gemmatimonadetes bacterium T265]